MRRVLLFLDGLHIGYNTGGLFKTHTHTHTRKGTEVQNPQFQNEILCQNITLKFY